jgi:hypothetical protein
MLKSEPVWTSKAPETAVGVTSVIVGKFWMTFFSKVPDYRVISISFWSLNLFSSEE